MIGVVEYTEDDSQGISGGGELGFCGAKQQENNPPQLLVLADGWFDFCAHKCARRGAQMIAECEESTMEADLPTNGRGEHVAPAPTHRCVHLLGSKLRIVQTPSQDTSAHLPCSTYQQKSQPGPNPFRAPIILNVYIKYDERKQALDVLVRNLQNTPLKRKVRERCPDGVVIVDARRTSKKRGPNPRFNEDFHFTPLIARDVKMGKLVFDIYEVKKKHKSFLGTIELCGSEIELKCDMAYSLYLHNPTVHHLRRRRHRHHHRHRHRRHHHILPRHFDRNPPSRVYRRRKRVVSPPPGDDVSILITAFTSINNSTAAFQSKNSLIFPSTLDPKPVPVTAVLPSQQSSSLSSLPFSPCRGDSSTDEVAIMLRADILYNERRQRMSVFIRNLEHVDEKLKHSVRCMLYTADGRRMEKQTKCKRGCNPYFNEEFKFRNLVRSDIRGGQLLFSVVQKHKKNVVGVGIIPGCRINLDRDEAHNIPICSKIPNKFVYNMEDVTREPESLIRIIYPKSSDHIEVYQ
ncbi:hypothetical protein EGR_01036 [Echinococcus granulosus]|uniref:C2 domain-containing protein n=1 Tax=Echinococcus granulosus TaxID=6210 RepID=W6URN7_ECHGR|nr:hypothetical protein EGR_01036 [Echinococcus granulosus]EUB63908.1 hypothetical protein EGR_01036 [Echinococcus granulosus]